MKICIAAVAYCIVLTVLARAVEIEPGFPTDCGVPAIKRKINEDAKHKKVRATPHSWPWNVGILSSSQGPIPYCGGTLISNSLILTAAHCVKTHFRCKAFPVGTEFQVDGTTGSEMYVLVGAQDFTRRDGFGQYYTIERAIVQPNFNINSMKDGPDLAILKIGTPITTKNAKPICFPSSGFHLSNGSPCFFAGWGRVYTEWSNGRLARPKILLEAQVELDFDENCISLYSFYKTHLHSCIKTPGTSLCHGDSGGGLFFTSEDSWFWYGVIIGGISDCLAGWAVVSNISSAHSWIRDSALSLGL